MALVGNEYTQTYTWKRDRKYITCAACQCRIKTLPTAAAHFEKCEQFRAAGKSQWTRLVNKTLAAFRSVTE